MSIDRNLAAYHSILWMACDMTGRIIVANSNEGEIPGFLDTRRAEYLSEKLLGLPAIDRQRMPPIDYDQLAAMGYYCFSNDDPYDGTRYCLRARPARPRLVDELDLQAKECLLLQKMEIHVEQCEAFSVSE